MAKAVSNQRARQAATEILSGEQVGDRVLAASIVATCARISEEMAGVRNDLIAACHAQGIRADAVEGPEDSAELQFHSTGVTVPAIELRRFLEVADRFGFRLPFRARDVQIDAIARYLNRISLVRDDAHTARLVLTLSGRSGWLPRSLVPTSADIASFQPGRAFAWVYPVLRVGRVISDRLLKRRAPVADSDFLGTPEGLIRPILQLLAPEARDVVFDLGCGDGRILHSAASNFGCRAVGVESNPELAAMARARVEAFNQDKSAIVEVREGFAEEADLSDATIVFLFMPPYLLSSVFRQVASRVRPGTRIVAHEQSMLHGLPDPDQSTVVVCEDALTVAHIWRIGSEP